MSVHVERFAKPLGARRARPCAEAPAPSAQRVRIKAVTVQQPWSWAITAGHKPVENRSWSTSHRGPLAIHAGRAVDTARYWAFRQLLDLAGVTAPEPAEMPAGALVAVADLHDVCDRGRDPRRYAKPGCGCGAWAADGQFHWRLATIRPLPEPVPTRGRLGLFDVELPAVVVHGTADQPDPHADHRSHTHIAKDELMTANMTSTARCQRSRDRAHDERHQAASASTA